MLDAKRILVAVDFSPESELALEWAIHLAHDREGASIELCHVLPRIAAPASTDGLAFGYYDFFVQEKKATERKLRILKGRIPAGIASSYSICEGRIAEEISRQCETQGIHLVVMTTHGRRGLSRLLQGSTTEETVRLAPCPVLVLHLNQMTAAKKSLLTGGADTGRAA